jgi:hypothetical protein
MCMSGHMQISPPDLHRRCQSLAQICHKEEEEEEEEEDVCAELNSGVCEFHGQTEQWVSYKGKISEKRKKNAINRSEVELKFEN